jgi:hypothetical protein
MRGPLRSLGFGHLSGTEAFAELARNAAKNGAVTEVEGEGGPFLVSVFRPGGEGIELWAVLRRVTHKLFGFFKRQRLQVTCFYPSFLGDVGRNLEVKTLGFPACPLEPMLTGRTPAEMEFRLADWLFLPSESVKPGSRIRANVVGLATGDVVAAPRAESTLQKCFLPLDGGASNRYRVAGEVRRMRTLRNGLTGRDVIVTELILDEAGALEICSEAGCVKGDLTPGNIAVAECELTGHVGNVV